MNDKIVVISNTNKIICDKINSLGYKIVYSQNLSEFISYEQQHADMQCIQVEDTIFVLQNCNQLIKQLQSITNKVVVSSGFAYGKYPDNILLNAKIIGKNLIGKIDFLDKKLVDYCIKNGYKLINVNQGYSGCSILKVTDSAIITSDESIYKALQNTDIDVLKISQSGITLSDAKMGEQGFIGGASVNLNNSILFFGDIRKHEDYSKIKEFCECRNISIMKIDDFNLTDIGGAILLKN